MRHLKYIAELHEQVIQLVHVIIELHWMHVLDILMCMYIYIYIYYVIILQILGNINKYCMALLWLISIIIQKYKIQMHKLYVNVVI